MTRDQFKEILSAEGYSFKENSEGIITIKSVQISGDRYFYIEDLKEIPPGVIFEIDKGVNLIDLKEIPDNITFKNGTSVESKCNRIGRGVRFMNYGDVYLTHINNIPLEDGDEIFQNGGSLQLVDPLRNVVKFLESRWKKIEDDKKAKTFESWLSNIY